MDDKLGALWLKGNFMTGVLELEGREGPKIEIVIFKAKNKKNDKSPDYYIFKSKTKEERAAQADPEGVPF